MEGGEVGWGRTAKLGTREQVCSTTKISTPGLAGRQKLGCIPVVNGVRLASPCKQEIQVRPGRVFQSPLLIAFPDCQGQVAHQKAGIREGQKHPSRRCLSSAWQAVTFVSICSRAASCSRRLYSSLWFLSGEWGDTKGT